MATLVSAQVFALVLALVSALVLALVPANTGVYQWSALGQFGSAHDPQRHLI